MSADYEDDAAETTEAHRRRLEEQQPSQSFQIFHPEAAKALRIQSEALQGLSSADLKAERAQSEEAERQEKADQVSQLQSTVLAPIQEGMQSVPDSQVGRPPTEGQPPGLQSRFEEEDAGGII